MLIINAFVVGNMGWQVFVGEGKSFEVRSMGLRVRC